MTNKQTIKAVNLYQRFAAARQALREADAVYTRYYNSPAFDKVDTDLLDSFIRYELRIKA